MTEYLLVDVHYDDQECKVYKFRGKNIDDAFYQYIKETDKFDWLLESMEYKFKEFGITIPENYKKEDHPDLLKIAVAFYLKEWPDEWKFYIWDTLEETYLDDLDIIPVKG